MSMYAHTNIHTLQIPNTPILGIFFFLYGKREEKDKFFKCLSSRSNIIKFAFWKGCYACNSYSQFENAQAG